MLINRRRFLLAGAAGAVTTPALIGRAETPRQILVAVATNFAKTAQALADHFEVVTGQHVRIASGATGQLYAQIINGAPYDIFLAADQDRPQKLEASGLGEERFTYARGELNLWNARGAASEQVLQDGEFNHLAIANPALAPYGRAAQETMQSLNLWEKLESKIVMGQNIGQAYALVASGNAEIGFVDHTHALENGGHWRVPSTLYAPILQDAVLLQSTPTASAFMAYLGSESGREIIRDAGYTMP